MKTASVRLYSLISFMTLIWGVNYVVAKVLLRSLPPLVVGPLRALISFVVLVPLWLSAGGRDTSPHEPWSRRELPQLIALGIFGIALNQIFFIVGVQRTSVAHASLVISTTPVQVLLLSALLGHERITARKLAGMATAVAGVAVLNLGRATAHSTLLGDFIVWCSSFTFALYTVAGKGMSARHGSVTVNTFGFAAGAAALLPLLWWHARDFPFAAVSFSGWWWLLYMSLFPSVICYLIYNYALSKIPASRLSSFSYTQPLVAGLTGLVFLGEPITLAIAGGGLFVLAGVWLVGR